MRQSKKGELRTPAEELDEIDRGGGGEEREKRDREGRDGEISFTSYSIEAAQLGLRRRTSEKGKHAEALEFGEGGGGRHIVETADQSRDLHTSQIFI